MSTHAYRSGLILILGILLLAGTLPDPAAGQENTSSETTNNSLISFTPPTDPAVPLDFPAYEPNNPEHFLIDDADDWAHVNDPDKRVFFVTPGDYREAGPVELSSSGQSGERRWLIYHNPEAPEDQTHPYHMDRDQQVYVERLLINGGDYWIVDRIRSEQKSVIDNEANHNVLNRILILDLDFAQGNDPLLLSGNSRHNTIQHSIIANAPFDPGEDVVGIVPVNAPYTRIVSNEIFNMAGDGIQAGPADQTGAIGTKIIDNDIYITPRMYTDGEGNMDPDGNYAGAENAIDIKQASMIHQHPVPKSKRMTIAYNRMWGFRETDTAVGGTGSGGATIVIHWEPSSYVNLHHNVFFDARNGYNISKDAYIHHHDVHHNLFWDINNRAIGARHIDHSRYTQNICVEVASCFGMRHSPGEPIRDDRVYPGEELPRANVIRQNVMINAAEIGTDLDVLQQANQTGPNAYYQTPVPESAKDDGSIVRPDVSDARHQPLTLTIKQITDPQTVTIPHGKVSSTSPHAKWFK